MQNDPPVDFEAKANLPINYASGGYPLQISSADLNRNFVFATAAHSEIWFEVTTEMGMMGHNTRRVSLKFPPPPEQGTHVLGVINNVFTWIETEDCDE